MNASLATRPASRIATGVFVLVAGLSFNLPAAAQQQPSDTPDAPDTVLPRARTLAGNEIARKQIDELMRMSRGGIVDKDLVHACSHALEAAAWGDVEGAVSYQALAELLNPDERDRCKAEARDDLAGSGDVVRLRMLRSPHTLP